MSGFPQCITIAGRCAALSVITVNGVPDPGLRFDRVAIALVKRLQVSLSPSVPVGKVVIVTITAPIRKESRTAMALEDGIRNQLATGHALLKATINGNRIQVRVANSGAARTPRLIAFVHNPKPDPSVLFDVSRAVLASLEPGPRRPRVERWLLVVSRGGQAPAKTVHHVCIALKASAIFKRILVTGREGIQTI